MAASINDYYIKLIFQIWLIDEKQHIHVRFELREKIYNVLKNAEINMPYETIKIEPLVIKS